MTSSTAPSSSALAPRSAGFGASVLGVEDAQQLARLSLQATSNLHAQIALWQRRGLDWPQIYLEGITEAARVLGRWWLCDEIDFASVTVGSSRLHRLLYDLSPQFLAGSQAPLGTTALLLAEPESQHTMGLFMLSEFFKREIGRAHV